MKSPGLAFRISLLAAFLGSVVAARADEPEPSAKPRDLGPPLVDNPKALVQFGKYPAWLNPKTKEIVLVGEACKADYPLEFLVTTRARAYESVLVIDGDRPHEGQPSLFQQIQTVWIYCRVKSGHPSYYKDGKTTVATGDEIAIEVRWKNKAGKTESADARNLIRHVKTKQPPAVNWVYAGSGFRSDGAGGKRYMGDYGDFICVLNNPNAMLDLPLVSAGAIEDRSFEANPEKLPPAGTPVTIILTPKGQAKPAGEKSGN